MSNFKNPWLHIDVIKIAPDELFKIGTGGVIPLTPKFDLNGFSYQAKAKLLNNGNVELYINSDIYTTIYKSEIGNYAESDLKDDVMDLIDELLKSEWKHYLKNSEYDFKNYKDDSIQYNLFVEPYNSGDDWTCRIIIENVINDCEPFTFYDEIQNPSDDIFKIIDEKINYDFENYVKDCEQQDFGGGENE